MPARPSNKEIINKVREALDALKAGKFQLGPAKHLSGDLHALELDSADQLMPTIIELLEEINAADPLACYAGGRPPQRSYEPEIKDLELWAYCWKSNRCGKTMYLKFALKKGHYFHMDCHESIPGKGY